MTNLKLNATVTGMKEPGLVKRLQSYLHLALFVLNFRLLTQFVMTEHQIFPIFNLFQGFFFTAQHVNSWEIKILKLVIYTQAKICHISDLAWRDSAVMRLSSWSLSIGQRKSESMRKEY